MSNKMQAALTQAYLSLLFVFRTQLNVPTTGMHILQADFGMNTLPTPENGLAETKMCLFARHGCSFARNNSVNPTDPAAASKLDFVMTPKELDILFDIVRCAFSFIQASIIALLADTTIAAKAASRCS